MIRDDLRRIKVTRGAIFEPLRETVATPSSRCSNRRNVSQLRKEISTIFDFQNAIARTRYRRYVLKYRARFAVRRDFRSAFRASRGASAIRRLGGSSGRGVAQYGRPGVGIAMAILLAAS